MGERVRLRDCQQANTDGWFCFFLGLAVCMCHFGTEVSQWPSPEIRSNTGRRLWASGGTGENCLFTIRLAPCCFDRERLVERRPQRKEPTRVEVTIQDKDRGEALLKVPELAGRIGVSCDWVYDAVNTGGMPCIRLNSRLWRFHWPTVLAWLQRQR